MTGGNRMVCEGLPDGDRNIVTQSSAVIYAL